MVDSQFTDDRYTDNEERNREALQEANRRAAEREAAVPKKKSAQERLSDRGLAMQMAAQAAVNEGTVLLKEFSQFHPEGGEFRVACRRIALQELVAGDLMPQGARKLVRYFIDQGMKATEGERARLGIQLPDSPGTDAVEEVFDGDTLEATEAYFGFIDAICIAAVRDPDIRLYWNEKAKGNDSGGLVVGVLPYADREAIAKWALTQEEVAAKSVEPFRQRNSEHDVTMEALEVRRGNAERSDQV